MTEQIDKIRQLLGKVFLGTPNVPEERQGWSQVGILIRAELNSQTFGLIRPFKLFLIVAEVLFPTIHIDQLMCWLLPQKTLNKRFLATYRDLFHVARTYVLVLALSSSVHPPHKWAVYVALYLLAEIVQKPIATVLVWSSRVIHPERSVVVALWSYAESILAFATLYLQCQCLNRFLNSATQALYFSAVTATTVGYGDIHPEDVRGEQLVLAQLAVSLLYVLFALNILLSRAGGGERQPPKS